eukprot:gnl/TRDRNA2_/TRDRNA2_154099_c1_seq1.p1 gnl/TRDRNA2_/TRDRNA2_154099_c1~~gnl/TRDRNA2_/TRDRNA2_154099_c1_seq1.p1  ORF type:complete len:315 (-),score=35.59 gnl/TRDRNA2_/TRDRNA2_154099_c1_seq1:140-1084(-)
MRRVLLSDGHDHPQLLPSSLRSGALACSLLLLCWLGWLSDGVDRHAPDAAALHKPDWSDAMIWTSSRFIQPAGSQMDAAGTSLRLRSHSRFADSHPQAFRHDADRLSRTERSGHGEENALAFWRALANLNRRTAVALLASACCPVPSRAFPDFGMQDPNTIPFTYYGTTRKSFEVLEYVEGTDKIMSRKSGVTARACISAIARSDETAGAYQGLPVAEKMRGPDQSVVPNCTISEVLVSRKAPESEQKAAIRKACSNVCQTSCNRASTVYAVAEDRLTGLELDMASPIERCVKACSNECTRPGKTSVVIAPIGR